MQITAGTPLVCLAPNIGEAHELTCRFVLDLRYFFSSYTSYNCGFAALQRGCSGMLESMMTVPMAALLFLLAALIPRSVAQAPPGYNVPTDSMVTTSGTILLVNGRCNGDGILESQAS